MDLARKRAADDHALDVARSLVDLRHAHVAVDALDREIADVAVAAVDLDGIRTHALGHFRGEQFRHRGFLEAGLAGVAQAGGVQHHLPRHFGLRGHVGKPEVHRLMFDDGLAEADALVRVFQCRLECRARHADRLGGDADAPAFQVGQRDAGYPLTSAMIQTTANNLVKIDDRHGWRKCR